MIQKFSSNIIIIIIIINNKILRIPVLELIFIAVHMSIFKIYNKIDLQTYYFIFYE